MRYVVRTYTSAEEIRRIMKTQPQKLSLEEMYLVAQDMEPGSEEYNETFEIAVRMFPEDATANLNAANTAMRLGNLPLAEKYLEKSGYLTISFGVFVNTQQKLSEITDKNNYKIHVIN